MLRMQLLHCARQSPIGAVVKAAKCGGGVNSLSQSLLQRVTCTSVRALSSSWDPKVLNEGRAFGSGGSDRVSEAGRNAGRARNLALMDRMSQNLGGGFGGGGGGGTDGPGGFGGSQGTRVTTRSEMLQFNKYVRQRIREMNTRLPRKPEPREMAELSFLEQQVVENHLKKRRQLRDPLLNTPIDEISLTNLPLLNRFLSDGGSILPRKRTGVHIKKQLKLAKAVKRARRLALVPPTWKLPKYRHASYTDEYSKPEAALHHTGGLEFADARDIRFPGQFEDSKRKDSELGKVSRGAYPDRSR